MLQKNKKTYCVKCRKNTENLNSKFLLAGDEFMPEMHLNQPGFNYSAVVHLTEANKELKNLCRLEIQTLFTEMNLIRLVFNMIWLIAHQKI